jgi:hypothetical protein
VPTTNTPSTDQVSEEDAVTMGSVSFAGSDRELVKQLVNQGKIEADSKLAQLARDENRQFSLAPETEQRLEQLLQETSTPTGTTTFDGKGALEREATKTRTTFDGKGALEREMMRQGQSTPPNRAKRDRQQRAQIDISPEVTVERSDDVEREVDRAMDDAKREVKRELARELTRR